MKNIDYAKISSDNVKMMMDAYDLSVRKLANKIGVAPSSLNDSLKSKKGIAIDTLIKIADLFKITVNDLCNPDFSVKSSEKNQINCEQIKNKYQLLDEHGKNIVSTVLDLEFNRLNDDKN